MLSKSMFGKKLGLLQQHVGQQFHRHLGLQCLTLQQSGTL